MFEFARDDLLILLLQAKMKAEQLSDASIAAFYHSYSELVWYDS